MTTDSRTIAILGGGPAGLALAVKLLRRSDLNARVTVIEEQPRTGGLSASFQHEGVTFDCGSHRLHPTADPEILSDLKALLGGDLLDRPRNGRIRLMGRFLRFPLRPWDLLRRLPGQFTLRVARDMLVGPFRAKPESPATAAEALMARFGPALCRAFYFPYLLKLWGGPADAISPMQISRRIKARSLAGIAAKALRSGARRGGAGRRFFYPRYGFGQFAEALTREAQRLGGAILLGCPISAIEAQPDGRQRVVVGAEGPTVMADFVFSTIPIPSLVRALRPAVPSALDDALAGIRYRAMVLCCLVLGCGQFSPFDAHYFPETGVVFSRLSEPTNYSDLRTPPSRTGLCAEIPCSEGDELWGCSEDAMARRVVEDLARVDLPVRSPIVSCRLVRLRHAYPIYSLGFESRLKLVEDALGDYRNVVTLGRQGSFIHDNAHHAMAMAYRASECLRSDFTWDAERWSTCTAAFAESVVED